MDNAVSHLRKSCYLELRKIANIRSYLSDAATLKLVLSLVISKLDYCNSLFYNMSLENIHKLQLIQNHAPRLVKKKHQNDPVLNYYLKIFTGCQLKTV